MTITAEPSRLRRSVESMLPGTITLVVVLLLMELLSVTDVFSSVWFPSMADTLAELWRLLFTSDYWGLIGTTLKAWATGLGIAALIGIPLGLLIGMNRWADSAFAIPVEFLRPVPSVALIPLAVVLWGTGFETKVFLSAFACTWPLLYQARYGAEAVDTTLLDTGRAFGLSGPSRLRRITLPSTLPYLATGVRLAASISLILVVTSELIIGGGGLGEAITFAQSGGDLPNMYALIITTGTLGWIISAAFGRIEARVLFWHHSQQTEPV